MMNENFVAVKIQLRFYILKLLRFTIYESEITLIKTTFII